ncbi:MAG: Crp/Fnr family transcriptional regulator [Sphingomonas taxi]
MDDQGSRATYTSSPAAGRSEKNELLSALSPSERAALLPHFELVPFRNGDMIARAGDPAESLCFPLTGIAAVLDSLEGDRRYAVALVGSEGFVGWPLLLGDDRWPHDVVMRAEHGAALRLSASALRDLTAEHPAIRATLLRFVAVLMTQMARTIVSSLAHSIERRMARWILLYHDRVREDDICMTHEEFRLMLGVRRSSVTDALHKLEQDQAIRSVRGRVIVRDRDHLLNLAGDTYGFAEAEYQRLLPGA